MASRRREEFRHDAVWQALARRLTRTQISERDGEHVSRGRGRLATSSREAFQPAIGHPNPNRSGRSRQIRLTFDSYKPNGERGGRRISDQLRMSDRRSMQTRSGNVGLPAFRDPEGNSFEQNGGRKDDAKDRLL